MPWQVPLQKARTRARLNLTVLVRISNRFSPHLGRGKKGSRGGGDGTRWTLVSIVPLRLFSIQFPRERTFRSILPNREAPLFAARVNFRGERMDKFLFLSVFFSSLREKRVKMIGYPARRRGNGRSALTLAFKVKRSCRYSKSLYCKIEISFNIYEFVSFGLFLGLCSCFCVLIYL